MIFVCRKSLLSLAPVLLGLVGCTAASRNRPTDDHNIFVVTHRFESQTHAQSVAALNGGWALDSDFYAQLPANESWVVRGPFGNIHEAEHEAAFLRSGGSTEYAGAQVIDAGESRLSISVGERLCRHPSLLRCSVS